MFTLGRLSQLSFILAMGTSLAGVAHANPYAFASDQISGLTLTLASGGLISATTATTTISDTAFFGPFGPSGSQAAGQVGNALTIPQSYAGPGSAPAAIYTPEGPPGTFTGARSDASIGAGSALSGGVAVNNVAEANGNMLGNSNGTDDSGISLTIMGTGQALKLSFSDLYQLIVSTDPLPNETANASLENTFTVSQAGGALIASYTPLAINQQIGSAKGVPSQLAVGPSTFDGSFTTPTLTDGTEYVVSFTSIASVSVLPGTTVPEPAAAGLLALPLAALGLVRWRTLARKS